MSARFEEVLTLIRHFMAEEHIVSQDFIARDKSVFKCGFLSHNRLYERYWLELVVDEYVMQTLVFLPEMVSGDKTAISEFIARANWEFKFGRFDINYIDGVVAFHFGQRVDVLTESTKSTMLHDQIYFPLSIIERFALGFNKVIHNELQPIEALKLCQVSDEVLQR